MYGISEGLYLFINMWCIPVGLGDAPKLQKRIGLASRKVQLPPSRGTMGWETEPTLQQAPSACWHHCRCGRAPIPLLIRRLPYYQTIPHHTIPYHTIPHHTSPHHTIPYHTTPYHTTPNLTIPYYNAPYNTAMHCTTSYCTAPYRIVMH